MMEDLVLYIPSDEGLERDCPCLHPETERDQNRSQNDKVADLSRVHFRKQIPGFGFDSRPNLQP